MTVVLVPVSFGELIDKLTILDLKTERVQDPRKRAMATTQHALLADVFQSQDLGIKTGPLMHQLKDVNGQLWDLENAVRVVDLTDAEMARLARLIFSLNDLRASLKRAIDSASGCEASTEIKEHI